MHAAFFQPSAQWNYQVLFRFLLGQQLSRLKGTEAQEQQRFCQQIWTGLGGLLINIRGCLPVIFLLQAAVKLETYSIVHTYWQLSLKKKSSLVFYKSIGSSGVIGSFSQISNCGMLGGDFFSRDVGYCFF